MRESEAELVAKARRGNEDALAALLEQVGPALRSRLAGKISSHWRSAVDEDDVLQVTYMEAFGRIQNFTDRGEGAFLAWLTQIAENNLRDAIRGLERAKRPDPRKRVQPTTREDSYVGLVEVLGVTQTTPSMNVAKGEIITELDRALAKLPPDYERCIRLYDLEGRSIESVCTELGRSSGAVYMLRARAHERLAEVLGSESRFFSRRS
ncbi:MAG: sigma-70 family RNA polymerase sigma factor [Phycisphaeraceae bacterium]|nr:sigma-70 family RNA polymerase sigma factor [Phycisphaeraceae bacterium]MCW5753162.1 sigma-70 family RNA polymerase sigma factor [Phycisphaeraceae bacterium]